MVVLLAVRRRVSFRLGAPHHRHPAEAHLAPELGYGSLTGTGGRCGRTLIQGIDVYPVETVARLVTHFCEYHRIEPCRATLGLDADPPAYAAAFQDIKGQEKTQEHRLGASL